MGCRLWGRTESDMTEVIGRTAETLLSAGRAEVLAWSVGPMGSGVSVALA